MGDLQDPELEVRYDVPSFWPHELRGSSRKHRPYIYRPFFYGIGTSNQSDPGMAIEVQYCVIIVTWLKAINMC